MERPRRPWLAFDAALCRDVLAVFIRVVFGWRRRRAAIEGIRDSQCGADRHPEVRGFAESEPPPAFARARWRLQTRHAGGGPGLSRAPGADRRGRRAGAGAGSSPRASAAAPARRAARGRVFPERSGGRADAAAGRVRLGVDPGVGGQRSAGGASRAPAPVGGGRGGQSEAAVRAAGGIFAAREHGRAGARARAVGASVSLPLAPAAGAGAVAGEHARATLVRAGSSPGGWDPASPAGAAGAHREAVDPDSSPAGSQAALSRPAGAACGVAVASRAPPGGGRRSGGQWSSGGRVGTAGDGLVAGAGRARRAAVLGGVVGPGVRPGRLSVPPAAAAAGRVMRERLGLLSASPSAAPSRSPPRRGEYPPPPLAIGLPRPDGSGLLVVVCPPPSFRLPFPTARASRSHPGAAELRSPNPPTGFEPLPM